MHYARKKERKKEKIKIINQHICKTIETKVVIKSFLKETTKDLMKVKQVIILKKNASNNYLIETKKYFLQMSYRK